MDIKSRMFVRDQSVFGGFEKVLVLLCLKGHKTTYKLPVVQIGNHHVIRNRSWQVIILGKTTHITTLFEIEKSQHHI